MGVIEFGATARQDSDQYSDKDIFAVVDDVDADVIETSRVLVASDYGTTPAAVACYSASSFDQMIEHGSLFTWHLRLEGRVLSDPDGMFEEAFGNLPPYAAFIDDLARFSAIYADALESFHDSQIFDTFERHVLFIVARNVCMLLTARVGRPTFGRSSVFSVARECYPALPITTEDERILVSGHLAYTRNISVETSLDEFAEPAGVIRTIGALIAFAEEVLT